MIGRFRVGFRAPALATSRISYRRSAIGNGSGNDPATVGGTPSYVERYHELRTAGCGLRPSDPPASTKCSKGFPPLATTSGLRLRYQAVLNNGCGLRPSPAPRST